MLKEIFSNKFFSLGAILLCAFALRVLDLQSRGVWYDEAFSIFLAEKEFGAVVAGAAADVHPLLYYFSLHFWFQLVGNSIFAARFHSVMFGIATIPLIFQLARELFGERVAILAALVLGFAPFHLAYSQEARMYAQLGFWSALAFYAFVRYEKAAAQKWWLVFVIAGAGALHSHNLAFIALGALGLWVALDALRTQTWRVLLATVFAGLAMILVWSPWLVYLPAQFDKIEQAYWVPAPTLATLIQTLIAFTFDFDNASMPGGFVPGMLFGAIVLPAFVAIELRRRSNRRAAIFAMAMAVLPIALLYLFSQVRPVYLIRALMPAFLWYTVLVAWALANAPRVVRSIGAVALAAFVIALLPEYYSYGKFPRSPFEQTSQFLRMQVQPGDAIVHDNKLSFFPMHLYDRALAQVFLADPAGTGSDTLDAATQRALQLFPSSPSAATANASRVWFVIFQEALDQADDEGHVHPNKDWLETHFKQVWLTKFNDLDVYLYQK